MPNSTTPPQTFGQLPPSRYPGERLGIPEKGPGSVARVGRRLAAYAIDALLAWVVYYAFFYESTWASLAIFGAMNIVFIPTLGGTIGHRLMGLFVRPLRGGYVGLWRPVVRTLLLCLLLPALVWDSDQRGFHDKIAGTVLVRR